MNVLIIGNPGIGLIKELIARKLSRHVGVIIVEAPPPEIELPKIDPNLLHSVIENEVLPPDPIPAWIKEKRKKNRK